MKSENSLSRLKELCWTFLKIGTFTFGGGYAMIPLIQQEVVKNAWISPADVIDFIGVAESTPGPFAVNISTFIGMETGGLLGAFIATLGVILPSFLIILLIAKFFLNFQENFYVKSALTGLRPTVIGLIASAAVSIFITNFLPSTFVFPDFFSQIDYRGIFILGIICF